MPKYAPNKMSTEVKRRYFELVREGRKGAAAARWVGVSTSRGSLWFIDAGSMLVPDPGPISGRFLTQDERIAIADGLQAKQPVKDIAASIGKSLSTVHREIERNSKPDGHYQPWWAHNQVLLRRRRPKDEKISTHEPLRTLVREAHRDVGEDVPGDHQAVVGCLGGVRALPPVRCRDPARGVLHERHRVRQRPHGRDEPGPQEHRPEALDPALESRPQRLRDHLRRTTRGSPPLTHPPTQLHRRLDRPS